MNKVCVFCSSSNYVNSIFAQAAIDLGKLLAENNFHIVYGGTHIGLMGKLAFAAKSAGAKITGIIPEKLRDRGLAWDQVDELIVTADMSERKANMTDLSDAFIIMPGGFGTLEEAFEVITLKQLAYHNKAVVLLNLDGFYLNLLNQFETFYEQKFASSKTSELFFVADSVRSAVEYIKGYQPGDIPDKVVHK